MIKKNESQFLEHENGEETRVKNAIGMAKQMCWAPGNNDHEIDFLNRIWENYSNGTLTADEAIKEANDVFESKNLR